MTNLTDTDFEYIVVGSGAGGGTVAARLAEAGKKVLVLEAGGDPKALQGGNLAFPDENRLPEDYEVPVFHTFSTENEAMRWDFFVRHFEDEAVQQKDPKYTPAENGVLYPRAGCLGGCTAHNAMITVYPHNADWNEVADLVGDPSWRADNMRKYFERMEDCRHRPVYRLLAKWFGFNPTRHGWNGWFRTEAALPLKALKKDRDLVKTILNSARTSAVSLPHFLERVRWFFQGLADPNDWRLVESNATGIHYPPLATSRGVRHGTRDRLQEVQKKYPDRLTIELDALVTQVLFDNEKNRAVGVEYLKGARLYRAHAKPSPEKGELRTVKASKEVILSGGAYNSPQLLMLSGIGPKDELAKHGIPLRVDLPGVGTNLQDRYEVGVVNRMNDDWQVLKGAKYSKDDPQYADWLQHQGVYTTNGAVLAVIRRSFDERPLPDLFCFALLGNFKGYFPGYSKLIRENLNYFTWAVLKAHTANQSGVVRLTSADPRDRPYINFRYFEEGNDKAGFDLDAVVEGIRFVRKLSAPLIEKGYFAEEELPGKDVQSDEQLRDYVRHNAWGHHASCTCPIGKDGDSMAVLDSNFRVRGVQGLRVVDASAFPKIPGFFIVSSIYLIGEKAADVILNGN